MRSISARCRGLSLLRQVAFLCGLRPGTAVTLALLRRLAWTATGISGIDLLGQTLADGTLSQAPVLRQIAAALPGTGWSAPHQTGQATGVDDWRAMNSRGESMRKPEWGWAAL